LVTGAGTFLAQSLVNKLLSLGFAVRGFDTQEVIEPIGDVEYVSGDVTQSSLLSEICSGVDHVFHLLPSDSRDRRQGTKGGKQNLATTIKLASIAQSLNVSTFVYLSAVDVYGPAKRGFFVESDRRRPTTATGKEHLLIEDYLMNTVAERGITVVIIRSAPITGWGIPSGAHPSLYTNFRNARVQRPLFILAGGKHLVQYVDVEDLTSAMVRCLMKVSSGCSVLNMASADIMTQRELAEFIIGYYGATSRLVSIARGLIPLHGLLKKFGILPLGTEQYRLFSPQTIIDPLKAHELLDLTPKRISESIIEMMKFWEAEDSRWKHPSRNPFLNDAKRDEA
jgi:nucleoside-diphosphate-sugar epimerase